MSVISNKIEDAKKALDELKRNRKFKKANASRAEAAELQASLAQCRGKLEVCKKDFNRTIRMEARNIAEGLAIGADTTIQEQTLWDAAIGYMMVQDAIYSVRTISSFDSVSHAYEMLDAAIEQITQRQRLLPKLPKIGGKRERNVYGYLTSNAALQQKQELLDGFFEELKRTGNIEACLDNVKHPGTAAARWTKPADAAARTDLSILDEVDDHDSKESYDDVSFDALMDIHPPRE